MGSQVLSSASLACSPEVKWDEWQGLLMVHDFPVTFDALLQEKRGIERHSLVGNYDCRNTEA